MTIWWHAGGVGWSTSKKGGKNDWQEMKHEGIMAKAPPCPERRMRTLLPQETSSSTREEESQWSSMEDRCRRRVAFEDAAKRMLRYLEDSEDLKVSISELEGQPETPEKEGLSIMQIVQQARNEKGQQLFETFRQGKDEVHIASLARWDTQLK